MRNDYAIAISELQKWVNVVNPRPSISPNFLYLETDVQSVRQKILSIACCLSEEYPFYASELPAISQGLFSGNTHDRITLNTTNFVKLSFILKQISLEPINTQFWVNIHPRIAAVSKNLFCDGYFDSAAEKAVRELETRLKELFRELKPGAGVPAKIGDVIGSLLGESGIFGFCDTSTVSGKDYRRGIKCLFDGIFAAYRNPAAHENLPCTKRESFEQITLASQLMYVLDKKQI